MEKKRHPPDVEKSDLPPPCFVDRLVATCVILLVASGMFHVPLFLLGSSTWEDPLSYRKAILFGVSTGMTLWSCDRVFRSLRPWPWDAFQRASLAIFLVAEVFLITMQTWRGERSHFHSGEGIDAAIETGMLALITLAVLLIANLTLRSFLPGAWRSESDEVRPARILAYQGGLVFLLVSCLIGFLITYLGNARLEANLAPEIYGRNGVLKFPHGAALHAIQTLELIAFLSNRFGERRTLNLVRFGLIVHALWLGYAIYQTASGRGRWEFATPTASSFANRVCLDQTGTIP